MHTQTKGAENK